MSIRKQIEHIGENLDKFQLEYSFNNSELQYIKYYEQKSTGNFELDNIKGRDWWVNIRTYRSLSWNPFLLFSKVNVQPSIYTGWTSCFNIKLNKKEEIYLAKKIKQRKLLPNPKEEDRIYFYRRKKEKRTSFEEEKEGALNSCKF